MEKARVYIYEKNGNRTPYYVDRVDSSGSVVKRPLELTHAECQELRAAQPQLFDPDNPNRIEMACKCCGKKLEPDLGFRLFDLEVKTRETGKDARGKPGFCHADEDDRALCPGTLALDPRFRDYFTDDSFDILEKERHQQNPKYANLDEVDDLLLGLVGADAYPGENGGFSVKEIYRLMLYNYWTPRRDRHSREFHGVGIQKLPFFVDDEERHLLVPIKLQLRWSQSGNIVKVNGKPVEYDFSVRFWIKGPSFQGKPDDLAGLGSGSAQSSKAFIKAKLGA